MNVLVYLCHVGEMDRRRGPDGQRFCRPISRRRAGYAGSGGRFVGAYYTLGEYDLVVISEGPSDEADTAATLAIAKRGNVRTTTMRAFTEAEFAEILKQIP